jgi:predicted transcriptional regulator
MKVKELSHQDIRVCPPGASLLEAALNLWVRNCRVIAVVEDEKVIGFVTDQELAAVVPDPESPPVDLKARDIMSRTAPYCRCDDDVEQVLTQMVGQGALRLPVVDAAGRPWGLLSLNDVLLKRRAANLRRPARPSRRGRKRTATLAG